MPWRESLHVPPMIHQNPIPTAAKTGNLLFTSLIAGRDPQTGAVPDSAEAQCENVFHILRLVLEKAGAKPEEVASVKVYIRQPEVRALFNKPWLAMFPDEHSRPARHTTIDESLGTLVQIEAVAVLQNA